MRYALAVAGLAAAAQAGKVTLTATEEVTITSCAPTHTACPYSNHNENEWENWESASADPTDAAHTWGSWDPKTPVASTATGTWGTWDPKGPASTASASHTWGSWDPKDPAASTATGTWGTWDPKTPVASTASSTWGTWDPAKTPVASTTASATWGTWSGASSPAASSSVSCPVYTATAPPAWFSQLPSSVLSSLAAKWTGAPPSDWCYYSYSNGVVTQTKTPDAAAASSTWAAWNSDATGATGVKGTETGTGPIAKYTGAASANAASFVMAGAAAVAAVVLA